MSHAIGALKFKDGTIRYYEYDGASDIVLSHHYETVKEVNDNWRNGIQVHCVCEKEETVSIFTTYGGGYYIDGVACKHCNSVRSNGDNFDIIEREETEDWAKDVFDW